MAAKKAAKSETWTSAEVLAALKRAGKASVRRQMEERFAIPAHNAYGAPMAGLKALAKRIGRDHALALELWKTGNYEARLLCSMIADPAQTTPALMDTWRRDFDSWAVTDTLCFNLFDKTPHAFAKVKAWAGLKDEFGKRAAFALLASLAVHDKRATDADFLACLPLAEKAARDERNFVKKAVSWALRAMGGRRAKLHAPVLALSRRLAASEDAAERWVGKDVVKDITRASVTARLAKKA